MNIQKQLRQNRKNIQVPAILLVVIIAGSIFGIKQYTYYQSHEDTDDAQVDGDLSAVVARVGRLYQYYKL